MRMKTDIKLIAVGAALGITLFTTLFHGSSATEHPAITGEAEAAAPAVEPEAEPVALANAADILRHANPNGLYLRSGVALIMDEREGVVLYGQKIDTPRPIASLTKLMTAAVILDAGLPLDELIEITRDDRDRLRGTGSRLAYGSIYSRHDLLMAALAASDNRAAAALARTYPGGTPAMIQAMNDKAKQLDMMQTRFADSSGLDSNNISTAQDLAKLAIANIKQPLLHAMTTDAAFSITDRRSGARVQYHNTNRLVRKESWDIGLSKTGYTADAGNCLIMQTTIADRPLIIVLLNSWGKYSRVGDSNRIRDWLIRAERKAIKANNTLASHQG